MNGNAPWALVFGSALGFLSVALGAFGTHALKARLPPDLLAIFQTGVQYQFMHALALLAVGVLQRIDPNRSLRHVAIAFVVGTVIFSGSLYLLVATGLRKWGMVTPLGGLSLLAGWLMLTVYALGRCKE